MLFINYLFIYVHANVLIHVHVHVRDFLIVNKSVHEALSINFRYLHVSSKGGLATPSS